MERALDVVFHACCVECWEGEGVNIGIFVRYIAVLFNCKFMIPGFNLLELILVLFSISVLNLFIIHVEPISLKNLKRRSEFFEQGKRAAPVHHVFFSLCSLRGLRAVILLFLLAAEALVTHVFFPQALHRTQSVF